MHSYKHCKEIKNSAVFAVRVDLPPLWMSLDNKEIIKKIYSGLGSEHHRHLLISLMTL